MSIESVGIIIPMKSGAAITRGCFVKLDSTNARQVVISAAEGDLTIGVAVEAASGADKWIGVQINGVAMVQFGGTVNVNGPVESNNAGKAVAAAGAASNTLGYFIGSATAASGEEHPVLLTTPVALGAPNA